MVVTSMISVVTWPSGQSVTVGGQEVMVWTEVVVYVEVMLDEVVIEELG